MVTTGTKCDDYVDIATFLFTNFLKLAITYIRYGSQKSSRLKKKTIEQIKICVLCPCPFRGTNVRVF